MRTTENRKYRRFPQILIAGLFALGILSCSTAPPPPGPIDDESSALGVAVKIRQGPLKLTSKTPEVVLFARLNDGADASDVMNTDELIASTHVDGEQAYLLNVSPGTYVAVAALYAVEIEPTAVPVASKNVGSNVTVGLSIDMFGGEDTYRDYFSQEIIDKTETTVGPREFAFMGRFVGNESLTFGDGDAAQKHFLKVLEGKDEAAGFVKDLFSSDHARRLSHHEASKDGAAKEKFFKNARKHLKDTAWVMYLDE